MPIFDTRIKSFKPQKLLQFNWDNFRGGLNTLLRPTELEDNELAQADNIMLVGKGIPTKRGGLSNYYLSGATSSVRGLSGFYKSDGTNELLAVTDDGFLTVKSNASYVQRSGVSWASGYPVEMAQLGDEMFIVSESRETVLYSGSASLTGSPTIAKPVAIGASQLSGATGTSTYSYRISALNAVGETLACDSFIIKNQPEDISDGLIRIFWTAPSTASGVLKGFNIYGRDEGNETWMAQVTAQTTQWDDDGSTIPSTFIFPPLVDSTGGVKAKYIVRYKDRLVYAGIDGHPTRVMFSGRYPNHAAFSFADGATDVDIEPDAGDNITGLAVIEDKVIVFKERSIWQVTLSSSTVGNFTIYEAIPQLITRSYGCVASRSIVHVENDLFFLGDKGVYILGREPNIYGDVLRTNELSVKVRPYFNSLTYTQKQNAAAIYYDFKYIISFPGKNETMVFDRERTCWLGPWSFDAQGYHLYYDSSGNEHCLLMDDEDAYVSEYSSNNADDKGTAIETILRTKKENWGDWSLFKNISNLFLNFRNVKGSAAVNIRLEKRDGQTTTAKSFSITSQSSNAGWGADLWGNAQWGDSEEHGEAASTEDLVKWATLHEAARTTQIEIKTSNRSDNYELLSILGEAFPIGRGFTPIDWKV